MESSFIQEHERWLEIVDQDLRSAKSLLKIELFSTAAYHCQQAAEKALKAYLVFNNQPITKTHDLMRLVELCLQFDGTFEVLYDDSQNLNPLATKFRYTTEFDLLDFQDTKNAVERAQNIVTFVLKKIKKRSSMT